jgi:predicted nucleotide-binding protein
MARNASFALLVHSAEDEQADGGLRARENVVHETGLFQGRLGFQRAIILREEGCEDFSNIAGIQEIRFHTRNIKETFGEVVATIRREFPDR